MSETPKTEPPKSESPEAPSRNDSNPRARASRKLERVTHYLYALDKGGKDGGPTRVAAFCVDDLGNGEGTFEVEGGGSITIVEHPKVEGVLVDERNNKHRIRVQRA